MADNVAYNPSGSTLFATKDDGTAHHQQIITECTNLAGTVKQTGHAEDDAHSSGDGGVLALGVRKDTAAATSGTDGDYQPQIFDANGHLWVRPSATRADDTAFTPATDHVLMIGAEADDTSPDSVDEGDAGALRMSTRRELYTQIRDAAGNERGVNVTAGNALKVDASAVAVPVTDNAGALTVDNAGTFAVQVDGSSLTALQLIDDPVKADDAGFTVGTDKVMMSGGIAVAHGSAPDAADANDAGGFLMNRHRVQFIIGGHPNIVTTRYNTTGSQTDTIIGPTNSAGTKMAVTQIQITADNANTASPAVSIGFGTANTPTGDGVVVSHPGLPGGGGVSRGDGSGLLGIGADGAELRITCGAPTGGSLTVVVSYYLIES